MATLRQLKYFVEIARSQSLTKAAQSLSVAQPALSQNMAYSNVTRRASLFRTPGTGSMIMRCACSRISKG
jgi:LysR family nitrogen assimilation transcriptional regulator